MSIESLEQFLNTKIMNDRSQQMRLKGESSFDDYVGLIVRIGESRGFDFTPEDVKVYIVDNIKQRKLSPAQQELLRQADLTNDAVDTGILPAIWEKWKGDDTALAPDLGVDEDSSIATFRHDDDKGVVCPIC